VKKNTLSYVNTLLYRSTWQIFNKVLFFKAGKNDLSLQTQRKKQKDINKEIDINTEEISNETNIIYCDINEMEIINEETENKGQFIIFLMFNCVIVLFNFCFLEGNKDIKDILDTVFIINRSQSIMNRKLDSILASLDNQNSLPMNYFFDLLPNFPLNSMEAFNKFNNDLTENEEIRKQFVSRKLFLLRKR